MRDFGRGPCIWKVLSGLERSFKLVIQREHSNGGSSCLAHVSGDGLPEQLFSHVCRGWLLRDWKVFGHSILRFFLKGAFFSFLFFNSVSK